MGAINWEDFFLLEQLLNTKEEEEIDTRVSCMWPSIIRSYFFISLYAYATC